MDERKPAANRARESSGESAEITRGLRRDHELILRGATALERCGARLSQAGGSALEEPRRLEALLAFFRVFLDRWHHAKEEEVLVPSLLAAGVPRDAGPLAEIVEQHVRGADLLSRLSASDLPTAALAIPSYTEFLRQHLMLEERSVFALAEQSLDGAAKDKLLAEFERIDRQMGAPDALARFEDEITGLLAPQSDLVSATRPSR
ncbi:MAG: hemerythrin domain-containing protein [bacterium]